jgi:hypothetical protein
MKRVFYHDETPDDARASDGPPQIVETPRELLVQDSEQVAKEDP